MKKLQREVGEATATVTEQKALIAQLEDDLRNVNALSSLFRGDAEVSGWRTVLLDSTGPPPPRHDPPSLFPWGLTSREVSCSY